MKKILLCFSFIFLCLTPQLVEAKDVLVVELDGPITSGTLELFKDSLRSAEEIDAEALIVLLDTPGGGVSETLEIIKLIDRSKIPVISYVHPTGAVAWSAGTLILISSHVAVMTPNTVIGSAQPASVSFGGFNTINESKVINALTTLVSEKARIHGRNEAAAVAFITENLNLNAESAKNSNVIDFISISIEDLLIQINEFELNSIITKKFDTVNARIIRYEPPIRIQFVNIITNPMLASLLLIIGIYAIIFGLSSPGYGSEIVGVILLALGLIGLGFDVNYVGIFLIVLGTILILVEVHTPSVGIFGLGGVVSIIIGSILLIPTTFPRYFISKEFQNEIIIMVTIPSIILGIFISLILYKVIKLRLKKPIVGGMKGKIAIVTQKIMPKKEGYVEYEGEIWEASSNVRIDKGAEVIIEDKKSYVLKVRKREKK